MNNELYQKLLALLNQEDIKVDEELKNHTYTKLGGKADFYLTPISYKEIQDLIQLSKNEKIPLTIIGNGSNLIIKDGGIRGLVVSLIKLNNIHVYKDSIHAQSGAAISDVSKAALNNNLSGIEFACGIPGTVGGAVFMNAGAYDGEIKDVLDYCIILDKNGKIVKRTKDDLELSYRYSNIEKNQDIILEAIFNLKEGTYDEIIRKMDDLTFRRETKQPLEYPSCGSVFKRPPGHYAGKLIQDSMLQGFRIGGAEVSKKHAGFIVNINNASAKDYTSLIEHVQKTVKDKFNIELETEVKIIGED